jgi:hypothetical protein
MIILSPLNRISSFCNLMTNALNVGGLFGLALLFFTSLFHDFTAEQATLDADMQ